MNAGLLLLHGFVGAALVAHAAQKLFVFRLDGTAGYLEALGFRSPRRMAVLVVGSEAIGGALLAVGFVIPLAAAAVAATMLVAARTDHRGKGWFITGAGAEYVATNAAIVLTLAAVGGGRFSVDHAIGLRDSGPAWLVAAAVAALVAAALVLSPLFQRRRACTP
jgi:putative oxidoreductase